MTAGVAGADEVLLYSSETDLPYFRPRLVSVAFGQATPESIRMHQAEWYSERRIALRLNTSVRSLKLDPLVVVSDASEEPVDAAVVACGATPLRPSVPGLDDPRVCVLWSQPDAAALHAMLRPGGHLVILGGGILGIEAALRAIQAHQSVTILERWDYLMPSNFGPRAATVLLKQLTARGIRVRTGGVLLRAESHPATKALELVLNDGSRLACDYMLISAGARPSLDLARASALETRRGIVVAPTLQTSAARIFAAGDVAELAHVTRCAVREATAQGRLAGANAAAVAHGRSCAVYQPVQVPLTYKMPSFEVYAVGLPDGPGCETRCLENNDESNFRALVLQNGVLVGVQMIGTREEFDDYAARVQPATLPGGNGKLNSSG